MEETGNAYRNSVGKPESTKLLEKSRQRLEDTIQMNLYKIGVEGVEWIHLVWDSKFWQALVNMEMNL